MLLQKSLSILNTSQDNKTWSFFYYHLPLYHNTLYFLSGAIILSLFQSKKAALLTKPST
jgi:hypothetical protein